MVKIIGLPDDKAAEYLKLLAKIESNNNPKAKAKTSSASGLYQPIKSTWEGYGYDWKDVFNVDLQNEFAERFTNDNAKGLMRAGCAVNFATLYGAHFLGLGGFLKIMRAASHQTPIEAVTTAAARKANPTILKGTVQDFGAWLYRKTGDDYTKRYTDSGFVSGPEVVLPPETTSKPNGVIGLLAGLLFLIAAAAGIYLTMKGN